MPQRNRFLHVLSDRSLRYVLFVFALTRGIVLTIFILTTNLAFVDPAKPVGDIKIQETAISLRNSSIARKLRPLARHCDCGWLIGIARDGYEKRPFANETEYNWVYFPLYPLLLRAAAYVTGGYDLTGMFLSSLLFLPALFLLHKTVLAFGFDEGTADRTCFYIAAYPTSYFFSLPMAESLFLCLTVGSFYAATRERWWLAGVLGALASATRPTGVLLLPALLLFYWERHGFKWRPSVLGTLLIPVGLLTFMVYLYQITGNAFAFVDAQVAWGRHTTFFLVPLYDYLFNSLEISRPWYFISLHFAAGVLALLCGLVLLKWRRWSLGFYILAGVILPLSTYNMNSLARYVMTLFPVFIVLAVMGRRPLADQTIRSVFLVLLALISALFAAHFSFTFP